ncbi:MalY/PatB family protein [Brevibacillus panacihumi]|uniref:cysteine-S-conjugate beta-lyase n=1 Tax=Brevibacillus panacihumi TaxID=497735 RepID=A0A3M8CH23_9BACL|nr:PatB family C-S lyase [Brevibacillus panacihumi]RNB75022.1 putative C-S lyase [Brevibacillus panacihumi]
MRFDFDAVTDRTGTCSLKWESNMRGYNEEGMIPLWVADMDFACPPQITEALARRVAHPIYGYSIEPQEFYTSLKDWIRRRFQVEVEESWMTSIPGIIPAMHVALEAYTSPGDKVIVQTPVYHPFFLSVKNRGREVVENKLLEDDGNYFIDFADLEQKVRDPQVKLLFLCSPHNPVGRIWSREELQRLGRLCVDHDVLVVADEIHADLVYEKGSHLPYYALPDELSKQSLSLLSASKTFNIAGLFTSYALSSNPEILRAFQSAATRMGHEFVNLFGVQATIAAYQHGEEWLDQLLVYLRGNAQFIHQFLAERVPPVSMRVPEASYLGWIDFRKLGLPQETLMWLLQKAKLGLHNGEIFGSGGTGFIRINFACPRSFLVEAMERLERAIQSMGSTTFKPANKE